MTKPNSDVMAKVAAARDAIELAAADLLVHAEGLATLAMMARWRDEHPESADTMEAGVVGAIRREAGLGDFIRNRPAEEAHWRMVRAAVEFAAAREAHLQATIMPSVMLRGLREAVEDVVGPHRSPPPPVDKIAAAMGDRHPGVRPEAVHRQAWLNYLVASNAVPASDTSNRGAA